MTHSGFRYGDEPCTFDPCSPYAAGCADGNPAEGGRD
jgi:hypothetical protein